MFALVLSLLTVNAQQARGHSAIAVEMGAAVLGDEFDSGSLLETGLRFGSLKPKQLNADVRFTTFPQALAEGFVLLALDVDATYVVPLGTSVVATPRAGLSALGGAGSDGGGAVAGFNVGLGIVARSASSPVGIRLDYGYRNYRSESDGFGASSFSFGLVWVH